MSGRPCTARTEDGRKDVATPLKHVRDDQMAISLFLLCYAVRVGVLVASNDDVPRAEGGPSDGAGVPTTEIARGWTC